MKVRITAIRKASYPDLMAKYENPIEHTCDVLEGQEWISAAVFLSIGICHPLVIKMEYQWGKQSWWVWLVAGLAFSTLSLLVQNDILSIVIGGFAFCCLWGIHEIIQQR